MTTQLLFYASAVPLRSSDHRDLYVKAGKDFRFARHANSVPITLAEFPAAATEYAIAFLGNEQAVFPVVLLGVEQDQNQFVDDKGIWRGQYVPAFVRRYPFVFSQDAEGKTLVLCIDEQFEGCNNQGRGERLFDAEGERTAYLDQVMKFQQAFQVQQQRTQAFCKRLRELDLLQSVTARLRDPQGRERVLTGLQAVDRAKLKALDPEQLAAMMRSDELELIYLHLHSMANLRHLGELAASDAGATAETATAPLMNGGAEPGKGGTTTH